MKKVKIILKSLLVILMTVLMSLTSLSSSTNLVSAGNATEGYDVDIYHGLGRGPSYSPTAGKVFTGMSLIGEFEDSAYKYSGKTAPGGYSANGPASGETNNKYYQKPQGDIKSIDIYYEDQMINIKSVVSGTTNCVKAAVYLLNGELQAVNTASAGPSSFPAGSTKLVIFQASGTGDTKDMASRWYNVPGDIKLVFHYKNEYKVTVNNVADTSIDEEFDTYFVDKPTENKTVTTISNNYSSEEGLVMKVSPRNATITSILFNTNEKVVLDDFSGIKYLNNANAFTSTHAETDILSYNPTTKEITFYNISKDLGVTFNYSVNVTLDPNNGKFADESTTPIIQSGANTVAVALPDGLTKATEGEKSFEFDGWYTSPSDFSSANKVTDGAVFDENTTLYAGWKETYKVTFDPGMGELNQESDYAYTNIVTSTLGSSDVKTIKDAIIVDSEDENIKYHFVGWYDNNAGLYTDEHKVDSAYVFSADTTVYALWENNYKITFNINGGQFSDYSTTDKYLYTDTVSFNGTLASRYAVRDIVEIGGDTYYALNAWFTSPTDFTDENRVTSSTVFDGDATVYAGWTLEKEVVSFYVDEELYTVVITGKGISISAPADPTKEGFTFLGWYTDDGVFENEYDFSSAVNSDVQLYALFKQTVNVNVVGGISASGTPVVATKVLRFDAETNTALISKGNNSGSKLVVYFDYGTVEQILVNGVGFAASELIGNSHKSVYIDQNGVKKTSSGSGDMMKIDFRRNTKYLTLNLLTINEDVTFELKYKDVTVTFYNQGALYAQRIVPFNTATDIEPVSDPYLEGYTFFGWFTDDETFENEFSLEGAVLLNDLNVYANLSKDFYLNVYYGYGRDHGSTHTLEAVFTGNGAMLNNDTGYSLKGSRNSAFSLQGNTAMDYRYDKPWQTEIDYIELYYNGSSIRVDHQISPLNNSVIKQDIYLTPAGQLSIDSEGNLPFTKFASSIDAANGSVATRWYEIPGAIDMVIHYYDENLITVKNIASTTINEDYDKYFVTVDGANKTSETIISGSYSGAGIVMNVTPSEADVDNITVKINEEVAVIEHSQIDKTLYLNADYQFVTVHSEGDILQYKNNTFTYYKVESDIEVEYTYQHTITLVPDKGILSNGVNVVKTVNGKIAKPSFMSEHVVVEDTDWYFAGWFDSSNNYVDFDEVITDDDTFTALWSNVPINIISVRNSFNLDSLDPITTVNAADYILFKGDSSLAELASTSSATMNVHAEHGVLNNIAFKLSDSVTATLDELAGAHYIMADGSIVDEEAEGYKIFVLQISTTNYLLTFANLENDLIITLNYEDLAFRYLLEDGSEIAVSTVPFNSAPVQIEDPEIEGYWFDGWYSDKTFTTPYDFSKKIIDNTDVYAKVTVKHTLRYINASSFTSTPISSSEWDSKVGEGLFDGEHSAAYTRGDFASEGGVNTIFNAALGNVKSITFAYGDKVIRFPDAEIEAGLIEDAADSIIFKKISSGYFLKQDGTFETNSGSIPEGTVVKFVHDKDTNYDYGKFSSSDSGGRYYNLRYYNINEDITVTIEYEDVNVTYIDENDATLVFNVDKKTANTVVSEDGRSFSVPAYDLKGDESHSIRIAIDPNLAKVKGVRFYSPNNPARYEDFYFVGNGSVDTAVLSKFGKIKAAYSVAASAVDGILYFRFLNLYESVNITPILYPEQEHTVTVASADGLSISNDEAPEGVEVSQDGKSATVAYGYLWKYTTASDSGSSSFKWNLGPTAGYGLEYSKLEVIDATTGDVLTTIGEDLESYKVNTADQTKTVMNNKNGLFIRYNKAPDSTAQIRVWAINKDVILKVYYKDFVNEGADIPYDEADFTPYQVKVTLKQTEEDAARSDSKFSYKTVSSVVTEGSVVEDGVKYITKSITSSSADLTGNNAEITKDEDIIVSNIIRLSLVDNSKYTVSKVTMTVEGHAPIILEANERVKDTEFGQFVFVMNGNDTHIRFDRIFTDKEIFISVEYKSKSMEYGPYTGVLSADERLNVTLDSSTPKTVTVSKDNKTITIPEDALKEGVSGKSVCWYLSTTAGMQYEYSKIEVSFYNTTTKKYEVVATLGDNFESYKIHKNGERDQTAGKQLQGLYVRYNKSHYGEAQIRVWNVYKNFKITVYYKDYETGKEYPANNSNLDFTPISYPEQAHTVTVASAYNLTIGNDTVPDGIEVSEDGRTITIPYNYNWKYSTPSDSGSSSFRWNLGPTAGYGLEYSKLEVIDATTGDVLTTIGEDLESYKVNTADQTKTVMNNKNGLFIRYNKAPDSTAQIRVWAINKDVILKVYYKDFVNEGADIPYDEADFTPYQVKVTLKQTEEDAARSDSKFSYKTVSSVVTEGSVVEDGVKYITKSITSSSADLTGNNAEITKDEDIIVSNIIRLSLVDNSKYTVSKVTMTVEGHAPIILEANERVKDTEFGQFVFVMNGNDTHIRFDRIFTDKEIFISVEYKSKSMEYGPYTGVLSADERLNVTLDSSTPKTVTVSKDNKTITIPEDALKEGVSGKSVCWYLSTTAGMQYEYSKIEVSFYNTTTKKYEVVATLGDNFESYKIHKNGERDQTAGKQLQGLYVRYNKSHYGEAQIRVWNVYKNFKITVYYKDYETGKEYAANNSNLDFTYDGVVTLKGTRTLDIETDIAKKAPVTKIDGVNKIRFNKYTSEDNGVKYIVKPTVLGDNIDTITVIVGGKSYEMGEGVLQYKATGKVFPGARVRFARSTDGSVQLRVWALTDDIEIEFHVSHNHKYTVSFDVGEHGTARIADIPASARVQDKDFKKIVVWQGSTNNSKAGNKTSIRYDVTPEFGYDIDYILFTTKGETYKIDNKELPNGKTLTTKAVDGAAVRYNVDSNGIAQIRVVHVDADCSVKVFYREITHKVIINTRKLAVMRAEGYNLGAKTEFTPNYAVSYVPGGATYARQNGIKYWLQPLEGHAITSIMIENSYGDYVICGGGFAPTEWEDYKLKGITCRYYQAYDGKIELRLWGVLDSVKITVFYDDETPRRGVALPEDLETYDLGQYKEGFDNMEVVGQRDLVEDVEVTEEKAGLSPVVIGVGAGVGALAVAGGVVAFILKRRKKAK